MIDAYRSTSLSFSMDRLTDYGQGRTPYLDISMLISIRKSSIDVGGPEGYTWNPFDLFNTYLRMGNFVGFISATYTSIMGEAWYGFAILIFAIPIYFRTDSLFYVCMVFLLGGGFFVYLLPPAAWHIAVVFMVLGVAGLLYKVFTRERD